MLERNGYFILPKTEGQGTIHLVLTTEMKCWLGTELSWAELLFLVSSDVGLLL